MIEVNASSPTIVNSTIRKAKYEGIYVPNGGSPKIATNLFIENGSAFSRAVESLRHSTAYLSQEVAEAVTV